MPTRREEVSGGLPVENILRQFLKNAEGSANMNVDGSVTPIRFFCLTPLNKRLRVQKLNVIVMDEMMDPNGFGSLPELSNGVLFEIVDAQGNLIFDLCDGHPIVCNADWALVDGGELNRMIGAAKDLLAMRWETEDNTILLPGWCIQITIRDDLSPLTKFRAFLSGRLITLF